MFTTKQEESFFLNYIKKEHLVLEYGSGDSTQQIANRCKHLISLEHQKHWYNQIISTLPSNVELSLIEPDMSYIEGGDDGTFEEFKTYVQFPLQMGPFDIILIDGRARVACASVAHYMATPDTLIFIHDFDRPEYQEALKYLKLIDIKETMAVFSLM